jgi:hypothetical protein
VHCFCVGCPCRARIPPSEFFRQQMNEDGTPKYSQYDPDGVPTHDSGGNELPKVRVEDESNRKPVW